jgi:hypothetical protein
MQSGRAKDERIEGDEDQKKKGGAWPTLQLLSCSSICLQNAQKNTNHDKLSDHDDEDEEDEDEDEEDEEEEEKKRKTIITNKINA